MANKNNQYNLSYFLNYMREPNKTPTKDILDNEELRKAYTPLIINRFLSFSPIDKDVKASILRNRYAFSFYYQPEINFGLTYLTTDKGYKGRLNYTKLPVSKKDKQYDDVVYDTFRKIYGEHLSIEEINEYVKFMMEKEPGKLLKMIASNGVDTKQLKKIFPELKDKVKEVKEVKITKSQLKKILKKVV